MSSAPPAWAASTLPHSHAGQVRDQPATRGAGWRPARLERTWPVFAAFTPRTRWLDGHLVLARRIPSPRFRRIDIYSPRNVVHSFRIASPGDVDEEFSAWLTQAYRVSEQRHLRVP